jgi:hypothetical protein
VEAGDHYIALGRVVALDVSELSEDHASGPLVFFQGSYGTVNG